MNRTSSPARVLLVGIVLVTALVVSSCQSGIGIGVGVGAPTRWGGGGGRPPVFVGGPAF